VEDRRHEPRDVRLGILVVPIGVDDDICPQAQTGVKTGAKGPRQPLILGMAYDIVNAVLACYLYRVVLATVVDNQ
jgi:hypothetical protein